MPEALETQTPIHCDYSGATCLCDTQTARQRTTYALYSTYAVNVAGAALSESARVTKTAMRVVDLDTCSAAYIYAFTRIEGIDEEVSATI